MNFLTLFLPQTKLTLSENFQFNSQIDKFECPQKVIQQNKYVKIYSKDVFGLRIKMVGKI